MKKIFLFLIIGIVAVSCSRENSQATRLEKELEQIDNRGNELVKELNQLEEKQEGIDFTSSDVQKRYRELQNLYMERQIIEEQLRLEQQLQSLRKEEN